ncbi:SGNH/GDSL hydrolase family protein [Flexilinea flocculi]|jgi:hypothetical protein|uniref:SGNH/GDSL hydrolase family protein n=1 Tax=Flexilinea flocculi TaxID=1678840 RepID=A0A0K8PCH0_9CHLR|nr:SGNH/GDSL hydrolase family protein [Flexilinea flocculi]GAP39845.1 hypothetical protein ATC1_12382 [Flexilinea flocculi]
MIRKGLLIITLSCTLSVFLTSCRIDPTSVVEIASEIAAVSTEIQSTIQAQQTPYPSQTHIITNTAVPSRTPSIPTAAANHATISMISTAKPTQNTTPGTATPDIRPLAKQWQIWPVIPKLTDNAKRIFQKGVNEFGTNPHIFSKIGDCQSNPNVFMGVYDMGYEGLLADEDRYLQEAIDYYQGAFAIESLAVHDGMSVASVLTTAWADPKICEKGENSLACELRVHNPSIMFINLGTNWIASLEMDVYYDYLSEIVEYLIARGILPILSSKADNVEGGHRINEITAQVARDYDIPFFNFWKSAQGLKNHGLSVENPIYLSVSAWNWRNYQALKLLHSTGKELGLF